MLVRTRASHLGSRFGFRFVRVKPFSSRTFSDRFWVMLSLGRSNFYFPLKPESEQNWKWFGFLFEFKIENGKPKLTRKTGNKFGSWSF